MGSKIFLLVSTIIIGFTAIGQNDTVSQSIAKKINSSLPKQDTTYFNTIDYSVISDSVTISESHFETNNDSITMETETKVPENYNYKNAISFLQDYYNEPSKNKHDSVLQSSLGLLLDVAKYGELRQLIDSVNQLISTTNFELKINTLNQYLDTLYILKKEYSLFRENKSNIDSIISLNDSLGLSSLDTNFIDQISFILDQSSSEDSLTNNISVDTLLHTYYIPDSLIISLEEFINSVQKDSLIQWMSNIQDDTLDFHFVDINKDSVHLKLYDNSPEVVRLNVTDVWGTQTPAIIRDIQENSFKLVLDESAEIDQVSVDKSKKALKKYSIGNANGIVKLSKRDVPTYFKPWSFHGNSNFNVSQIAFHQWTQGGQSSISLLLGTEIWWKYRRDRHSWNNNFNIKIGFIRQGDYDDPNAFFKPNDDRLDYITRYNYKIKPKLYGAFLVNFKTRTLPSYDYPTDTTRVIKSKFLSPADLTFSIGTEYRYNKKNIFFLSPLAWKNTMVLDSKVDETKFGLIEGESVRQELGMNFIATNYFKVWDDIVLKSTLELFSNYLSKPQNVDVIWDFELQLPVNNYILSKVSFSFIYDDNTTVTKEDSDGNSYDSKGGQFKEHISVGLMIKF